MPRKNAQHKARKRAALRKIKGSKPQDFHNYHRAQVAAWAVALGVPSRITGHRADRAEKWEATPGNG